MFRARIRLSADAKRIEILFDYHPAIKEDLKRTVPGVRWSPSKRVWTAPLDLTSGARLREWAGAGLAIDPALRRWGRAERRRTATLRRLSQAASADLTLLPSLLPILAERVATRPYQTADIYRMAQGNILNANEPGTGKTVEAIGAVAEAGLINRPVLTLAPVSSIVDTWGRELQAAGYPHWIGAHEGAPAVRRGAISYARLEAGDGRPFWLVVNPDFLRVKPVPEDTPKRDVVARDPVSGQPYGAPNDAARFLLEIEWGAVMVDEFHLFGLTNPRSQFGLAVRLLKADRLWLLSGTPMGGKFRRLWAILNYLYPDQYGSWWTWAAKWLVITDHGFGKVVKEEIQPGREGEFRDAHEHHFLRRTKLAELPGCPPQVHKTIFCGMTKFQEHQYREFEREAEIRIQGRRVTGHGILAEWTRLRSFANASCRTTGAGKLVATADSAKLPRLLELLAEIGIRKRQPEVRARAIIGTNDKSFARITARYLQENGIQAGLLVGGVEVAPIAKRFRDGSAAPYVIVMTVQKGGVSLNFQEARAAIALDESWNPDDTTQFFERGDRGSRTTPLLCITFRTTNTIQQYIAEVSDGKAINNENVYDYQKRMVSKLSPPSGASPAIASRVRGTDRL